MAKKGKSFRKRESKSNVIKKSSQAAIGITTNKDNPQIDGIQEKKSILQKLHQDYGLTGLLASILVAFIGGGFLLYVNGKLPGFNVEKPSETGKGNIDQSNRISVQDNNYIINNKTENNTTNIQKNQSFNNNIQQNKKEKLFEVYLRNDTGDGVSYQFYDYEMQAWVISTVNVGEEQRVLSTEPRVLFGLEDQTGNVYIFNTNEISIADANLKGNKITYSIKDINLNTVPGREARNYIEEGDIVWKVFLNGKEILPDPSLNILNNENIVFDP